ncbi:MAG: polysaccharide export outer membrane protein [Desulforhopalus sp.]|jgi:polysaccharide export outer membrane protein
MIRTFLFVYFFCIFFTQTIAFSAQSSADISITNDQKRSVLKEMLGSRSDSLPSEKEYVIGHGDILTVSIFEEGDMSVSAPGGGDQATDAPRSAGSGTSVMMDGRISLKHIGDVEVVGLTLTELADYLKQLYSVIYDDPIVTTTLAKSNSLRYTVMGEVAGPGIFFLDFPMNLVQIVARAGGFTEWASKKITVVRKKIKEEDKALFKGNTLIFDYDDFITGKTLEKNIFVRSNDIIIID